MIKVILKKTGLLIFILLSVTLISSYSSSADYVKTTADPTLIGTGARVIGMGGSFVGLSDDVNDVFMNPAGLADLKTWQVQSMTTQLLNVINYVSVAGTYNTDYGTFGLGYVGATLSGSFVTTLELGEGPGDIIIPVLAGETIDYTSSVILLSYGSEAKRFLSYGWLDKVSLGATIKIFSQGLSGGGISEGLSSGMDMDLAVMYKPLPWLSLGWNQVDALPASMGGKLTSNSGTVQELPTTTKLGMAMKVFGDDSMYGNSQPLVYLLDLDYSPEQANYPTLVRTGVEWQPISFLSIRTGFDQDAIGRDTSSIGYNVETNLCAGVGIQYNGFKFDYAYHKYTLSDNDTSYLSVSYSPPVEVPLPPPPPVKKDYLQVISPQDRSITYEESAVVTGKILDLQDVSRLTINDANVSFSQDGTFEAAYPLLIGKNAFVLKVYDINDLELASQEVRILRLMQFKDVPDGYWAKDQVELLATLGVIGGYPDGTFKPDKTITRAELTTLLVKTNLTTTPESIDTMFSDVTHKHWASFYVKTASETGIVLGYPDKTFRPAQPLNRAEGVMLLTRFAGLKLPETLLEQPYPDVPGRHWAALSISAARSAGMLQFLGDKPFEPKRVLTRSEAADVLSKTPFAIQKINNLKDFDSY